MYHADMDPMLVTGATGNVGRHLVRHLLDAGVSVRAAVSGPDIQALGAAPGLSTVPFDFTDPATWDGACAGVRTMFLLRPPHLSRPRRQMIPSLQRAKELGVAHVVLLSLQGAEKNRVVPHAALERWLRESGLSWTFVRASFFMQNLTGTHGPDLRERPELVIPAGRGATAFVDAADVAAVAAAAMLDPAAHRGRAWTPTGPEALTYQQVAATLGAELGRTITYRRPGVASYALHARRRLGMPPAMVVVTSAIYTAARLGLAGGLTEDVLTVTGRPPTSLAEFARREVRQGALGPAE